MPDTLLSMRLVGRQYFPGGQMTLAGYKLVNIKKENGEIRELRYAEQASPKAILEDLKRLNISCVDFERAWSAGG